MKTRQSEILKGRADSYRDRANRARETAHVYLTLGSPADERAFRDKAIILDERANAIDSILAERNELLDERGKLLEALKLTERGDTAIPNDIRIIIRSVITKVEGKAL